MDKARKLVEVITYNNRLALIRLAKKWGYEVPKGIDSLKMIYGLARIALDDKETLPAAACMMCDKGQPPRKAVTTIADIPACEQCAKEYQDAEDALGNEGSE